MSTSDDTATKIEDFRLDVYRACGVALDNAAEAARRQIKHCLNTDTRDDHSNTAVRRRALHEKLSMLGGTPNSRDHVMHLACVRFRCMFLAEMLDWHDDAPPPSLEHAVDLALDGLYSDEKCGLEAGAFMFALQRAQQTMRDAVLMVVRRHLAK